MTLTALLLIAIATPPASTTAAGAEYRYDPRAAVLGPELFTLAQDPAIPLEQLLERVAAPDTRRALMRRALAFADLHLRGLKRYCIMEQGGQGAAPIASFAYLPDEAFLEDERRRTAALLPEGDDEIARAWQTHAGRYHDEIRHLKRSCPGVPSDLASAREEAKRLIRLGFAPSAPLRDNLERLADNAVEALDVEAAFPRVQFAANALSYRLGRRAIDDPALLAALRGFVARYQTFASDSEDRTRLLDQALEASGDDLGAAVWLITFGFRNYPHIYDVYLLDPVAAARLEILFLRLKHFRQSLGAVEDKMLLHYPAGVYGAGDRRSSPYHFWSGGYVAHELLRKGHSALAAVTLGGAAQGGYEVLAALKYTVSHQQVDPNPLRRLVHFFDRSNTWEDTAGGLLGAFDVVDAALTRQAVQARPEYRMLRDEARRFGRYVKQLGPLYSSLQED